MTESVQTLKNALMALDLTEVGITEKNVQKLDISTLDIGLNNGDLEKLTPQGIESLAKKVKLELLINKLCPEDNKDRPSTEMVQKITQEIRHLKKQRA